MSGSMRWVVVVGVLAALVIGLAVIGSAGADGDDPETRQVLVDSGNTDPPEGGRVYTYVFRQADRHLSIFRDGERAGSYKLKAYWERDRYGFSMHVAVSQGHVYCFLAEGDGRLWVFRGAKFMSTTHVIFNPAKEV